MLARRQNLSEIDHENQLCLEDLYKIRAASKCYNLKSDISQLRSRSKVQHEFERLKTSQSPPDVEETEQHYQ